ncbi:MAG TPA: ABC transporter ATP-binding protein [archaeon]|nr:ABC transporter ATP-binding protein [archaeon]
MANKHLALESPGKPLLAVSNLTVRLSSGAAAVDGVSFTLERAECLALVGESGCGKTLTALSLLRAIPPEIGGANADSIDLDGAELACLDKKRLRELRGGRISMIFQDPSASLNPLFKVGNQIVETIRAHRQVTSRQARRQAAAALAEAGLAETGRIIDSYPHQLSGGQRQRAMIALALSTEPEILIADEPTTALDVTVQRQIIGLLARLRRSRGLALLLITHNLSVVAQLADRVLMMYAGHIVERAPASELFVSRAHPYTRALFQCLPGLDSSRKEPATIPGTVPQPGSWPHGCRFRPRCEFTCSGCEGEQVLKPFAGSSDHQVRCWLAEELAGQAALHKRD